MHNVASAAVEVVSHAMPRDAPVTAYLQMLKRIPLFRDFSDSDLGNLEPLLLPRSLAPGSLLFSKGERGGSMFIVVSGKVRVLLPATQPGAAAVVLQELGDGEFFGEMALIDNEPRMASVDAPHGAELVELTRESFIAQLDRSPRIGIAMLAVMARRLRAATELLDTPASRDINRESDEQQTWSQKLADRVAQWNGSWSFMILLIASTVIWTGINAIPGLQFDPYPYQFFNFFLAFLVAVQGPLLMMSQNRQVLKERLHAEADYRVNLKNETGIGQVLIELAELRRELVTVRQEAGDRSATPSGAADSLP